MASVAAAHGQIEDFLTIHINSEGVPVALNYELRDDAFCMGPRQMSYFHGTIPFGTNVTIIRPTSVKFVIKYHFLCILSLFIDLFIHVLVMNRVPLESKYPKHLKPGEKPPPPPATEEGIMGKLKKYVCSHYHMQIMSFI